VLPSHTEEIVLTKTVKANFHKDLVTEMRIATADEHLSLEKTKEQTYDLLDSFRLAVCFIK
jgi:hypothetical protein